MVDQVKRVVIKDKSGKIVGVRNVKVTKPTTDAVQGPTRPSTDVEKFRRTGVSSKRTVQGPTRPTTDTQQFRETGISEQKQVQGPTRPTTDTQQFRETGVSRPRTSTAPPVADIRDPLLIPQLQQTQAPPGTTKQFIPKQDRFLKASTRDIRPSFFGEFGRGVKGAVTMSPEAFQRARTETSAFGLGVTVGTPIGFVAEEAVGLALSTKKVLGVTQKFVSGASETKGFVGSEGFVRTKSLFGVKDRPFQAKEVFDISRSDSTFLTSGQRTISLGDDVIVQQTRGIGSTAGQTPRSLVVTKEGIGQTSKFAAELTESNKIGQKTFFKSLTLSDTKKIQEVQRSIGYGTDVGKAGSFRLSEGVVVSTKVDDVVKITPPKPSKFGVPDLSSASKGIGGPSQTKIITKGQEQALTSAVKVAAQTPSRSPVSGVFTLGSLRTSTAIKPVRSKTISPVAKPDSKTIPSVVVEPKQTAPVVRTTVPKVKVGPKTTTAPRVKLSLTGTQKVGPKIKQDTGTRQRPVESPAVAQKQTPKQSQFQALPLKVETPSKQKSGAPRFRGYGSPSPTPSLLFPKIPLPELPKGQQPKKKPKKGKVKFIGESETFFRIFTGRAKPVKRKVGF